MEGRQRHRCLRGCEGAGQMKVKYEPGSDKKGRESFTGTVTR